MICGIREDGYRNPKPDPDSHREDIQNSKFSPLTYLCSSKLFAMRKLILCVLTLSIYFSLNAQTLKTPLPSPPQTIKQDFGLSSIELSYSRPGVKNRKIFGELVPFGKVWRT